MESLSYLCWSILYVPIVLVLISQSFHFANTRTWVATQQGRKPYPDIIKLFVEMFKGNKELFLTEYRAILSDRLLAKGSYETNDEARTLEMLKIRFGEKALQLCEVMVKDVSDSKFINNNIHKKYDAAFDKTAILGMLLFWNTSFPWCMFVDTLF